MLDEYLLGDAERISPEAPIPVVLAAEERILLGGGGIMEKNNSALGGKPLLISLCGSDARADLLRMELERERIEYFLTEDSSRPTTLKTRIIARNQQLLRIDREAATPASQAITERILHSVHQVLTSGEGAPITVLILSDYGKGLITHELMGGLTALLHRLPQECLLLVDPKTPNYPLYVNAFLLTPNLKETREASGMPTDSREQLLAAGQKIMKDLQSSCLLTTLGANGMALFQNNGLVVHIPSAARKVFDVTGAGDTVIATVGLGLAAGLSLLDACLIANHAAGVVVGQVGAASVTPAELEHALLTSENRELETWAEPR